jgi:cytochrome oxidase Cu insertion factor (SCO1/SenC/PrrC family)
MISVRRRAQLGLFAAFLVLAGAMATLVLAPRYSKPVAAADVGTLAPDFQLTDLDGRIFTLSQHRGEAVVLFFGSVNSPRTAEYNPRVERLARMYASDDRVKFVALDMTAREGNSTNSGVLERDLLRSDPQVTRRSFPTLLDDHGSTASRYSAKETPTFVVIDARGVVRYRGPFDNSVDLAFATQPFCAQALSEVLGGAPTATVAGFIRQ